MKRNYKKLAVVIAVMILTLSVATTGFAANTMETLKAYYRNITIFKNGTQATFSHEPFIVDGTTYVPVRDMSELLGKTISFNPTTYRIDITDVADASTIALQTQLVQKEVAIKNLEAQVADLKAQLAKDSKNNYDLDDLEADLIDEFDDFEDVAIEDIRLSGDEDDIEVEIYIDLEEYQDEWDDIEADIDEYLQDVVDYILDEFDGADIVGFVLDESNRDKEILRFTLSTRDKVVLGSGAYFDEDDMDNLEADLNDDFYDYYDTDDIYFEFYLDSDDDSELEVIIDAYFDDGDDDFYLDDEDILDYLSETEIEDLLDDVYDYIIDINEFEDAEVFGEINGFNFDYDDGSLYIAY